MNTSLKITATIVGLAGYVALSMKMNNGFIFNIVYLAIMIGVIRLIDKKVKRKE